MPAVAELLQPTQLEVSVRCLLVLAMLLTHDARGRQQLASSSTALRALLALLKQQQDMDCKTIARDLLALLMRDEDLKPAVEAAMRDSMEQRGPEPPQQEEQPQAS